MRRRGEETRISLKRRKSKNTKKWSQVLHPPPTNLTRTMIAGGARATNDERRTGTKRTKKVYGDQKRRDYAYRSIDDAEPGSSTFY